MHFDTLQIYPWIVDCKSLETQPREGWVFYLLGILPQTKPPAHILPSMKVTTLVIVLVFAFGCGCRAETTEEMVSSCKAISTQGQVTNGRVSLPRDFSSGVCWGAFATIQTVVTIVDPITLKHILPVCVPPGTTRTQLIQIFLVYAQAHPEEYQKDYFVVAMTSMNKAFPCQAVNY